MTATDERPPIDAVDSATETSGPTQPVGPAPSVPAPAQPRPATGVPRAWIAAALAVILLAGAYVRLLGVDWDAGNHLHPDERFLTMVQSAMSPPQACLVPANGPATGPDGAPAGRDWYGCLLGYLDTDTSPLNPRNVGHSFFSYGTWSMTLVHVIARQVASTTYDQVYLVGRKFSAVLDVLALLLLFGVGVRLYDWRVGLLAAALGAFTAFSIQQAHFMTVDGPANFFVMLCFFGAVGMVRRGSWIDTVVAGVGMGMALATKIAMWPLAPVAVIALAAEAWRRGGTGRDWTWAGVRIVVLGVVAFATLRLTQPDMFAGPGWPNVVDNPARYADVTAGSWVAPDWWHTVRDRMPDALEPYFLPDPRWADSMHRISAQVTGYGMDWPPNHQWWGRTDWVFPWQNMVRWGMGIPLGLVAWLGWGLAAFEIARRRRFRHLLPWLWITIVFVYYGGQWGKTMRYFLPIYPLLTLLGAYLVVAVWDRTGRRPTRTDGAPREAEEGPAPGARLGAPARDWGRARVGAAILLALVLGGTVAWGWMFSRIYSRDHSRVAASKWIYHNLPTAFGLTVKDPESGDDGPGRTMPANYPTQLAFEDGDNTYRVDADGWVGPARVLVPLEAPVTIDGAQLNFVTDPEGDAAPERIRAVLAEGSAVDPAGGPATVLAEGNVAADLDRDDPQPVAIALPETVLQPDGEYYLWFDVDGAPISGRPARLAHHSTWDDTVPLGLAGYGPWDQAETPWGEGMFGYVELQLYDEDRRDLPDTSTKLERTLEGLQQADYTIATSNRVYGSVRQMPTRYPMTIALYDAMFGERFGFEHVADIHSYPNLGPWEVNDQPAEEAWHVYDHPRVDIWATRNIDVEGLRAALFPLTSPDVVTWQWPTEPRGVFGKLRGILLAPFGDEATTETAAPDVPELTPPEALLLSEERREAERTRADYVFDPRNIINRQPALAVVLWYLTLALLGLLVFPLVAAVLRNLPDRGWAVARTAGLLVTSWLAWLAASLGVADHSPALVWAAALGVGLASAWLVWRSRNAIVDAPDAWAAGAGELGATGDAHPGGTDATLAPGAARGVPLFAWMRANRRLLVVEELVFLALFALFLAIRIGNPDLWHPYYGGEKPMDFAYLNAVLRTVSFPPFDPWFAGGTLNYYYYGFVFVGALMEMTRIVPWISYNLAIPTLAALTGLGVFGAAYNWATAGRRGGRPAVLAGGIAAILAVVSGNLFQVPFIARNLAQLSPSTFESTLPGLQTAVRAVAGWWEVLQGNATLAVQTGHWYWNASRAIPDQGETVAITEMPFFTFLYADLHAHMMALPITVLALTVALSWAVLTEEERLGYNWPLELWGLGRILLGALAVGALWPTNTWDFPTYGLVAAGAIAAGHWQRLGGPGWRWVIHVGLRGGLLLGLALLCFLPYHRAYVTPYSDFQWWTSVTTPLDAYLVIHGIFLFAMTTWVVVRLAGALAHAGERAATLRTLAISAAVSFLALGWLWLRATERFAGNPIYSPSPWTPMFAALLLTLGIPVLLRPRAAAPERFAAWVFVLGVLLTQFVEFVVLAGDIGRMNTVFKFYIQVWVLWATLAAVCVAWLRPLWRSAERSPWGGWAVAWRGAFAILVASGLVYTVTAARAKVADRFPAAVGMDPADREGYEARNFKPGLSGIAYQDYAMYDEAQPGGANRTLLRLADDRDAFLWLLENVRGSPTILEAYNINGGYRWGARYSIYTGLPAVIGWDWHQKQQRNAVGGFVVDERTRDVAEMYDNPSFDAVAPLFAQYGVEYVVVGPQERIFYAPAGLAKFDDLVAEGRAERVYSAPEGDRAVHIYRLPPVEASAPSAEEDPG